MENVVYLAGPIQHAKDHGKGWRERLKTGEISHQANSIRFKDPLDKYNTHEEEPKEWNNSEIVFDDLDMIANSDAVLVHWEEVPSCGTPMEVFFASRYPDIGSVMSNLAESLAEEKGTLPGEEIFDATMGVEGTDLSEMDLLYKMRQGDTPVVVQTSVELDEISIWMTYHADVIVDNFTDAIHWIENEVGIGETPDVEGLDTDHELSVV
jgi:nucleoside 2-deoxyribosyltransferase